MSRPVKDSGVEWLGNIPADWNVTKIKYFYDCYDGRRVPVDSAKRKSGSYPYWGAGSIVDYVDDYLFDEELILLGEDGAPFFDHTRPVAFLINEKVWVNNHIHVLKPKPTVNSKFLVHWLNNVDYKSYINGSILNKLTQSNMNSIAFAVPPLEEQQRIATFLDGKCALIDSVMEKTRASIEEYKKLKQSIITHAVTKGIRPARTMKHSGVEWIGDIPADWTIIKLKYVFSIIGGNGFPDMLQGNTEGDYPFCKVSDINGEGDYVETASNWVSQSVVDSKRFNIIPTGSIIMAKIGAALAKNHRKINKVKCCIDNNTQALVPIRADDIRFLFYLSKCVDMSWFDNNSTVPSINNPKLLNFFVPFPPLEEQEEIASYLDEKCKAIDGLTAKKEKLLSELASYKKSLIFEYVTGKKAVAQC